MNGKVQELGSFWVSTAPYVEKAKKDLIERNKKKRNITIFMMQNENNRDDFDKYNDMENQPTLEEKMKRIAVILKKAGIDPKFFPFVPQKNKEGELIGFVPKGKNDKEIKENIEEYKRKMEEALEKGAITQEEFDELNENLEELMKENDIELDDEKEMEITDQEIMDNIKQFIVHNYGDQKAFEDDCKNYENLDLEDRKFKLQDVNSKINTQLGIAGDLKFSSNPNMKFENSFFDKGNGGYFLTEKEVQEKGLGPALYTMMEKSMMRQREQKMGQVMSPEKKKQMHEKIMAEKKKREEGARREKDKVDKKVAEKARQRMRNLWNG